MASLDVARRYFEAWQRRDPEGIAAAFAPEGTFWDADGERACTAVAGEARRLFEALPDLTFELRGACQESDDGVVLRWTMRSIRGGQVVRGADFVTVAGDRIAAVERYADREAVRAARADRGDVLTGTVVRVGSERRSIPGAFGITWQETTTDAGRRVARDASERIVRELPGTAGFIGGVVATVGDRFLTVTAWEEPNNPYALIREGAHRTAAGQFFAPRLYSAGWTGVWRPERLNALWLSCASCGAMASHTRSGGSCACGAALPAAPAYW